MKRDKTIKYIVDNSIDEMVKQIFAKGTAQKQVIDAALESRKEYGLKVQELIERLSTPTTVINKHHQVPYDIYIGRGSKWGNPFSHMENTTAQYKVSSRDEAIEKYREWIVQQPELMSSLHELKGKVLCCYCKPQACHGDVLAELADK